MPTFSTAARNAKASALGDLVDGGTLELLDGAVVIAIFELNATAFGAPATGVITAADFPQMDAADATGTIDGYAVKASGGSVIWSGDASELDLDTLVVNSVGQEITLSAFTYTEPAS